MELCKVNGCSNPRREYKGRVYSSMCTTHMSRRQRHGGTEAYAKKSGVQITQKNDAWVGTSGYLVTTFYGVECYVHRLVYLITHGELPPKGYHIHHRDHDRMNNHWDNLVAVTAKEHSRLHREEKEHLKRRT